ncbi:hypothetical protein CALCODRAFT_509594 [Calocera cornea HHB12733]|uniref:Uncharacterized protein n=1 Tax=Calocera cornea HHB12733 TaxID=1353952 RepID=A0A165F577_9BASI|nr:hypothetical protein CALCODRAFT_509594 [Calocera cornea HHB12733]
MDTTLATFTRTFINLRNAGTRLNAFRNVDEDMEEDIDSDTKSIDCTIRIFCSKNKATQSFQDCLKACNTTSDDCLPPKGMPVSAYSLDCNMQITQRSSDHYSSDSTRFKRRHMLSKASRRDTERNSAAGMTNDQLNEGSSRSVTSRDSATNPQVGMEALESERPLSEDGRMSEDPTSLRRQISPPNRSMEHRETL